MKSVKRTIVRVVTYNKLKRTVALIPKGTESDYNNYGDVIVNVRTFPGLQMASKVFIRLFAVLYGYFNTPTPTIKSSQNELNIRCTKTFSEEH